MERELYEFKIPTQGRWVIYNNWISSCVTDVACAMPGNPSVIQIKQPDGSTISAITRGDEFQGGQRQPTATRNQNKSTGFYTTLPKVLGANLFHRELWLMPSASMRWGARLAPATGPTPPRNLELERSQNDWINALKQIRTQFRGAVRSRCTRCH